MNRKYFKSFFILIALGICFNFYLSDNQIFSIMEPGFIIEKGIDANKKFYINIKTFEDNTEKTIIEKKIIIKQRNIWNLIIENKAYQLEYKVYPNQTNILIHIDYANQFEKKYKEYFLRY